MSHFLRIFWFYLVIFIISVFLIETARIIEAQIAIDTTANSGVEYASTGRYLETFCGTRLLLDRTVELLKNQDISVTTNELLTADGANPERCAYSDRAYKDATVNMARYLSILEIIREKTPTIIDVHYLKIVICSAHPGFTYDSDSDTCFPQEYPGQLYWYPQRPNGDKAFASLTYEYPFGSSLGLDILKIRLHVFKEKKLQFYR